jgi:hypothetical protein
MEIPQAAEGEPVPPGQGVTTDDDEAVEIPKAIAVCGAAVLVGSVALAVRGAWQRQYQGPVVALGLFLFFFGGVYLLASLLIGAVNFARRGGVWRRLVATLMVLLPAAACIALFARLAP